MQNVKFYKNFEKSFPAIPAKLVNSPINTEFHLIERKFFYLSKT